MDNDGAAEAYRRGRYYANHFVPRLQSLAGVDYAQAEHRKNPKENACHSKESADHPG
jgi:hypothetical protein